MKKRSPAKIIIGIFTVILSLSFIILVVTGINEIQDYNYEPSYYNEENYVSALQNEDYMELLEMTCRDSRLQKEHNDIILSCKAVAHYYEAAALYKAYLTVGNKKAAGIQVQRMEQYASQTGDYQEYVEKINTLLELHTIE